MNTETIRSSKIARALLLSAVVFSLAAGNAVAQTASPTVTRTDDATRLEKFEVTGSLIKVSELVGPSPVDIITDKVIQSSGVTDTAQLLKRMNPGFQGNGNVSTETNNGGGGEAYIALRNLTTLVLVNGRRLTSSPYSNGSAVDLNTIPLAMIDHIEILKDGASTTYGSDAIGGVVNLILKKNYNGFDVRARYGATRNRDYTTRGFSIVGGVSKEGSSITVGLDTFKNDQLSTTSRSLATLDAKALIAGGSTAALPSYYSGSFAGRVGSFVLAGSPLAKGAPGYNASITSPPAKTDPNAAPQTIAQLAAAGIYVPIAATTASINALGATTILNTTQFGTASIVPTDRRQVVVNGEHEITGKQLVAFADVFYSQTINSGTVLAPSPLASVGGNRLIIPATNPYNLLGTNIGLGFTGDPGVRTRLEEVGNRSRQSTTDTYRVVAGLKGEINENYSWQVDATYSRANWTQLVFGGANGSVMNQLLTPQIVNGAYVYNAAGKPLSVFSDGAGAVPVYNYFGIKGSNDPRSVAAIQSVLFQNGSTQLNQLNALFRGTPFDLPAGKLGFAVGAEYRKEDITAAVDGLFANGLALGYGAANTFAGGKRSTKSVNGEVDVPLIGGAVTLPGVYFLSLNLAGRYEKLSTGDTSKVPKVGVKWQPLDKDLTLRSTYAKGFIAPSIYSLYGPSGENSPTFTILEGSATAPTAPGGSSGRLVTGQFGSQITELSNPALKPSESKSFTLGAVYSPKFVKGLTLGADYYFVKQDHQGGIDYTSIFRDLNSKGSGSALANKFTFTDGSKLTTATANQVTSTNIGSLSVVTNPSGELYTDGLDLNVDYKIPSSIMGNWGMLGVGANANVLFNYKFHPNPQSGNKQYARQQTGATYGLGGATGVLPGYNIKYYATWNYRGFTTSLNASYLPAVVDAGSLFGGQATTNAKRADGKAYKIPSYTTVDLTVSYLFQGRGWYNNIGLLAGV
ncbi:MAG: TonB-dependent receptor, partial [Undibacterium sp.]|nr:TonB-dependent receptor [Opitutaceae bacterium]